jgi:DNA-binding NtrC family response regulator
MNSKHKTSPPNMPSDSQCGRVLVVDDHAPARESMADVLRHAGHQVNCVSSAVEALGLLADHAYDVVVTDYQMPGVNGLEFIRQMERRQQQSQILMVTAHASVSSAVEAMRHGAFDYIEKPFDAEQLEELVSRALAHGKLMCGGEPLQPALPTSSNMIGSSPAMQALREAIAQAAPTPETILICGESGTGKELVARDIHAASDRHAKPLVSLNCPVLSAHLMESELFGHERGAFTGAEAARSGRFELADGGSILLDEITEVELTLQAKLLRVLQEKTFERVGSNESIHVDVRVLATTNRDLREAVDSGKFREDLYYRLAVVPLRVPPLRERREDIPELIEHFLQRAALRLRKDACTFETSAIDLLSSHNWPGNVRELENIVTRASVLNRGGAVRADDLRPWLIGSNAPTTATTQLPAGMSLEEMERRLIEATLERFDGHRAKTAEALGIGLRTLTGKLKDYGCAPRARRLATA